MNLHKTYRRLAGAGWLLAAMAPGCTDDAAPRDNLPRVAVAGNVTLGGSPLPAGQIQFQPIGEGPAAMAVGEIQDGRYAIEQTSGPSPGKYRVMISSRTAPKIGPGEQPGGANLGPETIPKKYNAKSTLEVEIPTEGPATRDFPLDGKP